MSKNKTICPKDSFGENLWIWQQARELVKEIYNDFGSGPCSKDYGFRGQIQQAGVSIFQVLTLRLFSLFDLWTYFLSTHQNNKISIFESNLKKTRMNRFSNLHSQVLNLIGAR